jgi:hypothetical protein
VSKLADQQKKLFHAPSSNNLSKDKEQVSAHYTIPEPWVILLFLVLGLGFRVFCGHMDCGAMTMFISDSLCDIGYE